MRGMGHSDPIESAVVTHEEVNEGEKNGVKRGIGGFYGRKLLKRQGQLSALSFRLSTLSFWLLAVSSWLILCGSSLGSTLRKRRVRTGQPASSLVSKKRETWGARLSLLAAMEPLRLFPYSSLPWRRQDTPWSIFSSLNQISVAEAGILISQVGTNRPA